MPVNSMDRVMQRIRQVVVDADDSCETDADLLARFLRSLVEPQAASAYMAIRLVVSTLHAATVVAAGTAIVKSNQRRSVARVSLGLFAEQERSTRCGCRTLKEKKEKSV